MSSNNEKLDIEYTKLRQMKKITNDKATLAKINRQLNKVWKQYDNE